MRIVLGVAGGIAAYKAAAILRLLTESGHDVRVVPTRAALEFVGRATWEALSGHPVSTEVFEDVADVPHVRLGRRADLVIVAPATADLLARATHGRADDLLTATLLTATCPVVMAPAMHTEMWQHPATRANVATLRERGVLVIEPDSGRLTGADTGPGRLPEPGAIVTAALATVDVDGAPRARDLTGRRVVISAGGTREALDPVRFLGNRSSGKQGVALARAALARGAEVTLVGANLSVPAPAGVRLVPVESTDDLRTQVRAAAVEADVVVMAAAVADFRPAANATHKIKKQADGSVPPLELVQNPDILAELAVDRLRPGQLVVGFAAETGDGDGDVLDHGRRKARRKGADLLAVNAVGVDLGFGTAENSVTLLDSAGVEVGAAAGSKDVVAHAIWDAVVTRMAH